MSEAAMIAHSAGAVSRSCLKKCKKYGRHGGGHDDYDEDYEYKVRRCFGQARAVHSAAGAVLSYAASLVLPCVCCSASSASGRRWSCVCCVPTNPTAAGYGASLMLPQGHSKSFRKRHGKDGY
jgi:hypothetical protein